MTGNVDRLFRRFHASACSMNGGFETKTHWF
jgi:hypothetical protein